MSKQKKTDPHALPVAFYFMVKFNDASGSWEVPFKAVSGIKSGMDPEEVKEGGENRFIHKLPTRIKFDNLVLKSAVEKLDSPLIKWCKETLESDFRMPFSTKNISVMLLNEEGNALMQWYFENAYPIRWEIDGFDSAKNEVAIETIELCYSYFTRNGP